MSEFWFRYKCADDKRWFWKTHWIDFITSIPIPPANSSRILRLGRAIRFIRLLRALRLFRLLRLLKAFLFLSKGITSLQDVLDVKTMKRSLNWALGVIILGALVISRLEGSIAPETISSFGDSLWWSFSTVVTGGYADLYNPSTVKGQLLTSILVLAGMILIGVFTATLTSLYVGEDTDEIEHQNKELVSRLENMEKEIQKLHDKYKK